MLFLWAKPKMIIEVVLAGQWLLKERAEISQPCIYFAV